MDLRRPADNEAPHFLAMMVRALRAVDLLAKSEKIWQRVYPVHARIRKSLGEMTRKLSDTASQ